MNNNKNMMMMEREEEGYLICVSRWRPESFADAPWLIEGISIEPRGKRYPNIAAADSVLTRHPRAA